VDLSDGLDQAVEGQVYAGRLALGRLHSLLPRAVGDAEFRGRRLRNFPDGVWIFDCENSIDDVEKIAGDSGTSNCADAVPTFLNARSPAVASSRDLPDTVWLFSAPGAIGEYLPKFRDIVA